MMGGGWQPESLPATPHHPVAAKLSLRVLLATPPLLMVTALDVVRYLFSCTLVSAAIFAVIAAIATNRTSFYGVPQVVQVVLLVFCLLFLGILEGLQM